MAVIAGLPSAAAAQTGLAVSLFSEVTLRGYSVSAGQPAATLDVSYDDPGGAYVAASGAIVANSGVRPLSLQASAGYATRLKGGLTLDIGANAARYSRYEDGGLGRSYWEAYAGLAGKAVAARLSLSPHYFHRGEWAAYGEVNGHFGPARLVELEAHAGLLVPMRDGSAADARPEYDWRIAARRTVGRAIFQAALVGGGPDKDFYRGRQRRRERVVLGITLPL